MKQIKNTIDWLNARLEPLVKWRSPFSFGFYGTLFCVGIIAGILLGSAALDWLGF